MRLLLHDEEAEKEAEKITLKEMNFWFFDEKQEKREKAQVAEYRQMNYTCYHSITANFFQHYFAHNENKLRKKHLKTRKKIASAQSLNSYSAFLFVYFKARNKKAPKSSRCD